MLLTISQQAAAVKGEFGHLLNGRIERATKLALTGGVKQTGPDAWEVSSLSQPGQVHKVTWAGRWACDCHDHLGSGHSPAPILCYGGGQQATCQHILATSFCDFAGEYPAPVAADLVIVTRRVMKFAGHTQSNDGKVLWWKKASEAKVTPRTTRRLSDPEIQARLSAYVLLKQDCLTTEIYHYFRKVAA